MLSNTVRNPNILVEPMRWDSGATFNVPGPRGSLGCHPCRGALGVARRVGRTRGLSAGPRRARRALAYEMIGEFEAARQYFLLMKEQAQREANAAYLKAAELGFERTR